jgi:HEAT repeat protein
MEDLLVRRAVVFGLARVKKPWAISRLEQIQVEDSQWAVKSVAQQALEDIHNPDPHIPVPLPPLTETPWLIAYAGKKEIGVAPGEPAKELVLQAFDSDDMQERLAALDYFRLNSSEKAVVPVIQLLYEDEDLVKEKAYITLFNMAATGIIIPPPEKFGLPNLFQVG